MRAYIYGATRFHNLLSFLLFIANITTSREAHNIRFHSCVSTFRDVYVIKYIRKLRPYDMTEFCKSLNVQR